jgi:RES domain-containing protein
VYTAGSSSGAILELLVHTEDYTILNELYTYIPVDFDSKLIKTHISDDLPSGWNRAEVISATQRIGDEWVDSASSVVLRVPSVVAPDEFNYLINPVHPDFRKLRIGEPRTLPIDSRL